MMLLSGHFRMGNHVVFYEAAVHYSFTPSSDECQEWEDFSVEFCKICIKAINGVADIFGFGGWLEVEYCTPLSESEDSLNVKRFMELLAKLDGAGLWDFNEVLYDALYEAAVDEHERREEP
jgi:hypothetical protein